MGTQPFVSVALLLYDKRVVLARIGERWPAITELPLIHTLVAYEAHDAFHAFATNLGRQPNDETVALLADFSSLHATMATAQPGLTLDG